MGEDCVGYLQIYTILYKGLELDFDICWGFWNQSLTDTKG